MYTWKDRSWELISHTPKDGLRDLYFLEAPQGTLMFAHVWESPLYMNPSENKMFPIHELPKWTEFTNLEV